MKTFNLLMLIVSLSFAGSYKDFAEKMQYETSYEVAVKKAQVQNKELMLFMVTNYCPWCSKMEKRVLIKADVHKAIKEGFIPLILNKEEKNFPKKFDVPGTPVIYLIHPSTEKVYASNKGYLNKDDLLAYLKRGKI